MQYIISIFFTLLTLSVFSQGAGILYVDSLPTDTPDINSYHAVKIYNKTDNKFYSYQDSAWIREGSIQGSMTIDSASINKLNAVSLTSPDLSSDSIVASIDITTDTYKSAFFSPLTPRMFGAVGDGVTDDASAFQSMFDYGEDNGYFYYHLEGLNYYTSSAITLPDSMAVDGKRIVIDGGGAQITTDQPIKIFQRFPAGAADDSRLIDDHTITIKNVDFDGSNIGGSVGLYLAATYNAVVEDCYFYRLDTALLAAFSLNGRYKGLRFTQPISYGFFGMSGSYYGASAASSSFNANVIEQCRVYNASTTDHSIHIESADGNVIRSCITEGDAPAVEVYVSTELSVNKNNYIEHHWSETPTDTNTVIYWFKGSGDLLQIENIQCNSPDTLVFYDHVGGAAATVRIINPSISGAKYFANYVNGSPSTFGGYWWFDMYAFDDGFGDDIYTNSDYWAGGSIPSSINLIRQDANGIMDFLSRNTINFISHNGNIVINNDSDFGGSRDIVIDSDDIIFLEADNQTRIGSETNDDIFVFNPDGDLLVGDGTVTNATLEVLSTTGSTSFTGTASFLDLDNYNTTVNNFSIMAFGDDNGEAGRFGLQHIDHVNNYGQYLWYLRDADGYLERFKVTDTGIQTDFEGIFGGDTDNGAYDLQVNGDAVITGDITLDVAGDVRIITGSGTPEGSVTAGVGSTYHRTDGGAGTSFYVKESGTGNTGWVAK